MDELTPEKQTLGKTLKNAGGSIFNRTLGRLFGAGLEPGAEKDAGRLNSKALWRVKQEQKDWRVKLTLRKNEDMYTFFFGKNSSQLLKPLSQDGGVTFPLTPTVMIQHNANYNPLSTTHANYPFYAYQNSEPAALSIVGEFPVQNREDALYWVSTLHFFRACTKMFFGGDDATRGNPPPIMTLNGYGNHVFNNVPVILTNFTCELRDGIDYISTATDTLLNIGISMAKRKGIEYTAASESIPETWAPTLSTFTLQLQPVYSRESVKKFNMKDFVQGNLDGTDGVGYI